MQIMVIPYFDEGIFRVTGQYTELDAISGPNSSPSMIPSVQVRNFAQP